MSTEIRTRQAEDDDLDPVSDDNPLATKLLGVSAVGGVTVARTATVPLTGSGAYASGDFVGTYTQLLAFGNMARVAGGTGLLQTVLVTDKAVQSAGLELWLFTSRNVVLPADNAAWTITDIELLACAGVVPIGTYYASALNSVGVATNVGLAYQCAAGETSLYGALVTRGTPTYTGVNDLRVTLVAALD